MTISNEIKTKIESDDMQAKPASMVEYLKEKLVTKKLTADELYEYARDYFWDDDDQSYVINKKTIYLLGLMLSNLESDEDSSQAPKFFKLAADRDSAAGCKNYACTLLEGRHNTPKNIETSITYFKKAITLYENKHNQRHQCQYHLALALREDSQWQEANKLLIETFAYYQNQITLANDDTEKAKFYEKRQKIIDTFEEIIGEFSRDFSARNIGDLDHQWCKNCLAEMAPILSCKDRDLLQIQQKLHYLKGKYHEKLDQNTEAWKAYCIVKDSADPNHEKFIAARAALLKKQVAILAFDELVASTESISLTSSEHNDESQPLSQANTSSNDSAVLPASQFWGKGRSWFDTVDKAALEVQFDNVEDDNNNLSPRFRKIYRRHQTEANFFKPKRSKKKTVIINLVNKIIDQRYRAKYTNPEAIDLTDVSSRILITAERVYQEAVLSLSDYDTTYKLGIPKHHENHQFSTEYGPVEKYQVGSTIISIAHRANPKRQRLGDSYIYDISTYTAQGICGFLNKITGQDSDKASKLARYMIRYSKNHTPVTLAELQQIYARANNDDVHKFHRICFLILEKEQAQWHSATEKKFRHGMALAQARCLCLIEAGYMHFDEAFKRNDDNSAPVFGIYSGTNLYGHASQMQKACEYIDKLYSHYLNQQNHKAYLEFFKANIKKDGVDTVLTRRQGHRDMLAVYGGDSDTDSEGYETELSM